MAGFRGAEGDFLGRKNGEVPEEFTERPQKFDFLGDFSGFLGDVSEFLGDLGDFLEDFSEFLRDLSVFLGDFSEFLGDSSEFLGDLSEFLGDVSEFLGDFTQFLGDLSDFRDPPERSWRHEFREPVRPRLTSCSRGGPDSLPQVPPEQRPQLPAAVRAFRAVHRGRRRNPPPPIAARVTATDCQSSAASEIMRFPAGAGPGRCPGRERRPATSCRRAGARPSATSRSPGG